MTGDAGILAGLKVVEFAQNIAIPHCGRLLVGMGADVVKIEGPAGDRLRRWSATGADLGGEDGAFFRYLNASKRSVVLSLGRSGGREALLELARSAEVDEQAKGLQREAEQRGVFGVPTMILEDELFWGNDRLPLVRHALQTHAA